MALPSVAAPFPVSVPARVRIDSEIDPARMPPAAGTGHRAVPSVSAIVSDLGLHPRIEASLARELRQLVRTSPDVLTFRRGMQAAISELPAGVRREVAARANTFYRPPIRKSEWHDKLPGGEADKKKPEDFDQEALAEGRKHEREHTDDDHIATEIAMDHLSEDPDYYTKIKKIEKGHGGRYTAKKTGEDGKTRYSYRKSAPDEVPDGRQEAAKRLREKVHELVTKYGRKGMAPNKLIPLIDKYGQLEVTQALREFGTVSISGETIYISPYEVHESLDTVVTESPHEEISAPHHTVNFGAKKSVRFTVSDRSELRKAPRSAQNPAPGASPTGAAPPPSAGAEMPQIAPSGATPGAMAATAGAQNSAGPTGRTGTVAMPEGSKRIWHNRIFEKKADGKWHVVGHIAGLEGGTEPGKQGEFSVENGGVPFDIRALTKDQAEYLIQVIKDAEKRGKNDKKDKAEKTEKVEKADSRGRTKADRRAENAGDRHHRRAYMASAKGKKANRKAQKNYRSSHPERYRAQQRDYEPAAGHKCAVCGAPAKHKHHQGYGEKGRTVWLCHKHHVKAHHPKSNITKASPSAQTGVALGYRFVVNIPKEP